MCFCLYFYVIQGFYYPIFESLQNLIRGFDSALRNLFSRMCDLLCVRSRKTQLFRLCFVFDNISCMYLPKCMCLFINNLHIVNLNFKSKNISFCLLQRCLFLTSTGHVVFIRTYSLFSPNSPVFSPASLHILCFHG